MSDWKNYLVGLLDDNGFGKRRDFQSEIASWVKDWVDHLNTNSSDLLADYNKDYEGNIVVNVKKRVGNTLTVLPYKCKIRIEHEDNLVIDCVIGVDLKVLWFETEQDDNTEKHFNWKRIENKGKKFVNKDFVLGQLNEYLESWLKKKRTK
jgi:hypothetical protein